MSVEMYSIVLVIGTVCLVVAILAYGEHIARKKFLK